MSSTWLVSGTTSGIGLGLVKSLLSRPSTTVIATTRSGKPNEEQRKLSAAAGSKLIVLKLEAHSPTSAADAIAQLQQEHGIKHLDVVWANAGMGHNEMAVSNVSIASLEEDFNVNTLGPIRLLQAALPLLRAAKAPKFVVTSTAIGSVELASQLTFAPPGYGMSKAAINYLLRRLNEEDKDLIVVTLHPGLVETNMGGPIAKSSGRQAISVEESVEGILLEVDQATKQSNDRLRVYNHTELPW